MGCAAACPCTAGTRAQPNTHVPFWLYLRCLAAVSVQSDYILLSPTHKRLYGGQCKLWAVRRGPKHGRRAHLMPSSPATSTNLEGSGGGGGHTSSTALSPWHVQRTIPIGWPTSCRGAPGTQPPSMVRWRQAAHSPWHVQRTTPIGSPASCREAPGAQPPLEVRWRQARHSNPVRKEWGRPSKSCLHKTAQIGPTWQLFGLCTRWTPAHG